MNHACAAGKQFYQAHSDDIKFAERAKLQASTTSYPIIILIVVSITLKFTLNYWSLSHSLSAKFAWKPKEKTLNVMRKKAGLFACLSLVVYQWQTLHFQLK